jgi:GDP-L-fucose synthase
MRVFIAGGTGLVGSSLIRNAPKDSEIHAPSRTELDLRDRKAVAIALKKIDPEIVMLAAAKVGGIAANSKYQRDFLVTNLDIQNSVIMSAREVGVRNLVFLGSSCIYPKEAKQPISEDSLMTGPLEQTNEGYAIAKIAGLRLCRAISEEDGLRYFSLMPTNLYGPNDNFHKENSHVPAALLRRFHEAKINKIESVKVWGTGRPRREFMHVDDLASACWSLVGKAQGGELLNVGTGIDISIGEFAHLVARIVGYEGRLEFDLSKPDGTFRKLLNVERIHGYGWSHRISLEEGLKNTYKWYLEASQKGTVREF